jgi:hypothetical protein
VQAKQLGLITGAQAVKLGLSRKALRYSVARGEMERVRRDVWVARSVAATYEQAVLAAVLAAGDTAFVSHLTAAWFWHLLRAHAEPLIELTTVLERRPDVEGVRMHRSGLLMERDITRLRCLPISTPERTIIDCSSRLSIGDLGVMTDDSLRRRITTIGRLVRLNEQLPPAPGRSPAKVRKMLARRIPGMEERDSVLEDFVYDSLRKYGVRLPVAQHQVCVGGRNRRIDLCYPEEFLALEAQGFDTHGMRHRFDDDALRGNELQLAGFRVLEFTSAFTDQEIARQVAVALGETFDDAGLRPMTFDQWLQRLVA